MLLVDDLAAGGTKNLRHTPRGLVTLTFKSYFLYSYGATLLKRKNMIVGSIFISLIVATFKMRFSLC